MSSDARDDTVSVVDAVVVDAEVVEEKPRPWGLWATLGWSLMIVAIYFAVQIAVLTAFVLASGDDTGAKAQAREGFLVCVAIWISNPICVTLIAVLAAGRRRPPVSDYLALRAIGWRPLAGWLGAVVLFAAAVDGITYTLGREVIPKAVLDLYTTSESPLFFASVLLLAAPVFEEVFARGFMFRGIQASRLGNVGAVVLTSLVWSGIHLQYDWYHLLAVLAAGVLLGIARVRTRSLYTTIAMHSVWNLIATLEVWWYVHLCRLS